MEDEIKPMQPCPHTKPLLSSYADGKLRGWLASYLRYHLKHCGRCQHAFQSIQSLKERLRKISRGPEDEQEQINALMRTALDEAERRRHKSAG